MLKRYTLPCALVIAAALVIGFLAYSVSSVAYTASCLFRVELPPTAAAGSDYFTFSNDLALREVALAQRAPIFAAPAQTEGVDPGVLAAHTTIAAGPEGSYFDATVSDSDAQRAGRLANGVCDQVVAQVAAERRTEADAEVADLRDQINRLTQSRAQLSAKPAPQRTPADNDQISATDTALTRDQLMLAQAMSVPPATVSVVARSSGGVRSDSRSLTRNLLIAGTAGLLASFLVVLVGEIATERRRPIP